MRDTGRSRSLSGERRSAIRESIERFTEARGLPPFAPGLPRQARAGEERARLVRLDRIARHVQRRSPIAERRGTQGATIRLIAPIPPAHL